MGLLDSLFGKKKAASPEEGSPALVQAMHAVAANDNAYARKELYQELLASMLLIPVQELPPGLGPGKQTLQSGVQLPLFSQIDKDQIRFTVAFTDLEALRNWDPNTPYLGLKAVDFFGFLLKTDIQDIMINPFDPIRKMIRPGGRVKRREIEQLAHGSLPANIGVQHFEIKKKEEVLIGLPANPPSAAVQDLLRNKATDLSEVSEVYFFQMARPQTASTTVIGVWLGQNTSEDRKREIMKALGTEIQREMGPGQFLDFMFLQGAFGESIRKIGGLIFRR